MDVGNSPSTHASDFLENSSEHPRIEADVACHPGAVRKTSPASRPVGETHTCLNKVWKRQPQRPRVPQNRRSIWLSIRSSSAVIPILSRCSVHTRLKLQRAAAGSSACSIPPQFQPRFTSPIHRPKSKPRNFVHMAFLKRTFLK